MGDDHDQLRELFSLAYNEDWNALISRVNAMKDPKVLFGLSSRFENTNSPQTDGYYQDDDSATLLHLVCSSADVTETVVKALLDSAGPELVSVVDTLGRTALHDAFRTSAPIEIVEKLVTAHPHVVHVLDNNCLSPLDDVCRRIIMREEGHRYGLNEDDNFDSYLWECARIMLRAFANPQGPVDQLIMHACIHAGSHCPLALRQRIMKRYANQLGMPDEAGNLPLHIAAGLFVESDEEDMDEMEQVLWSYPDALNTLNNESKHPLDVAIDVGRTWSSGAGMLFEASPEALVCQDFPISHYPLILSEMGRKASINAMYRVIKAEPELFMKAGQ